MERPAGHAPARERREERAHDARERDRDEELVAPVERQQVEKQHESAGRQHDQCGQEWPERDRGKDEVGRHCATLAFVRTWAISASSVASVLPVKAVG